MFIQRNGVEFEKQVHRKEKNNNVNKLFQSYRVKTKFETYEF